MPLILRFLTQIRKVYFVCNKIIYTAIHLFTLFNEKYGHLSHLKTKVPCSTMVNKCVLSDLLHIVFFNEIFFSDIHDI